MLRIYKSSGTNYIGNGTNNFILNTGTGAIISNSIHSSPNYANSQSITYNMFINNLTSGSYEIEVAKYFVKAGNKVRLYYYSQCGNYFNIQANSSSSLSVTLHIYSIYIRIYKDGTMISNSLFNSGGSITGINGNYMILNSPSNGGVAYYNNNTEMLRKLYWKWN